MRPRLPPVQAFRSLAPCLFLSTGDRLQFSPSAHRPAPRCGNVGPQFSRRRARRGGSVRLPSSVRPIGRCDLGHHRPGPGCGKRRPRNARPAIRRRYRTSGAGAVHRASCGGCGPALGHACGIFRWRELRAEPRPRQPGDCPRCHRLCARLPPGADRDQSAATSVHCPFADRPDFVVRAHSGRHVSLP